MMFADHGLNANPLLYAPLFRIANRSPLLSAQVQELLAENESIHRHRLSNERYDPSHARTFDSIVHVTLFVADTVIGIIHYRKIGDPFSMAHHCLSIYAFIYVLTLNVMPYFANFRLLAELSTPLVNMRYARLALAFASLSPLGGSSTR